MNDSLPDDPAKLQARFEHSRWFAVFADFTRPRFTSAPNRPQPLPSPTRLFTNPPAHPGRISIACRRPSLYSNRRFPLRRRRIVGGCLSAPTALE